MDPTADDSGAVWQIADGDACAWCSWDGEAVVYDARNGATHLLGPGPTLIFGVLRSTPQGATSAALASAVRSRLDAQCDPGEVEAAILALMRLDLVRARQTC